MADVFQNATNFNQPLSNWNVSKVTNMSKMFNGASNFNKDISIWKVGKVTDMSYMFNGASGLGNLDLSSWDIGSVRKDKNVDFMKSAGSGNTPPIWLPRDIKALATITYANMDWETGTVASNHSCVKFNKYCDRDSRFAAAIKLGKYGRTISFKFNRTYGKGTFGYYNRQDESHEPYSYWFKGSWIKFKLKGKEAKYFEQEKAYPANLFYHCDVEFDEVVLEFYGKNPQGWRNITLSAQPYD
jgi:surface protein